MGYGLGRCVPTLYRSGIVWYSVVGAIVALPISHQPVVVESPARARGS